MSTTVILDRTSVRQDGRKVHKFDRWAGTGSVIVVFHLISGSALVLLFLASIFFA